MKIVFIFTGKTTEKYIETGMGIFLKRISHYHPVETLVINPGQGIDRAQDIKTESDRIAAKFLPKDIVIALDERGEMLTSSDLAAKIQGWMNRSPARLVFVTGGAYGLSEELKKQSDFILSFSRMTFTHQMIRLLLAEQVYRAMSILKGAKYHH